MIELYEGYEQNNPDHFSSYEPLKNTPIVHAQSYIFAQGISAISSTDTGTYIHAYAYTMVDSSNLKFRARAIHQRPARGNAVWWRAGDLEETSRR